ncbi:hypothetical protein FRX31_022320 [Thalictrum thalictroides]|uniref:C3H1-type domain-containing protein n=1 Tax=Thalictrum thalictroides TaxID=46969 RepID=A0A7J6VV82_THATH|nr:hypothetical protein FRX31_022320 [Thalictrum thalictroides]
MFYKKIDYVVCEGIMLQENEILLECTVLMAMNENLQRGIADLEARYKVLRPKIIHLVAIKQQRLIDSNYLIMNTPNKCKTALCKNWREKGYCASGELCTYAHGSDDLREAIKQQPLNESNNLRMNIPNKYKTVLCKNWREKDYCANGELCTYAHGSDDLRQGKSGKYKTVICRNWQEMGRCNYGNDCWYAHGDDDLQQLDTNGNNDNQVKAGKYKTRICRNMQEKGKCDYGNTCQFAHGMDELLQIE